MEQLPKICLRWQNNSSTWSAHPDQHVGGDDQHGGGDHDHGGGDDEHGGGDDDVNRYTNYDAQGHQKFANIKWQRQSLIVIKSFISYLEGEEDAWLET